MFGGEHNIKFPWGSKSFWKGNVASDEAGCDRCDIRVQGSWEFTFELPRQAHEVRKLEHMLGIAFEYGSAQNRRDVAEMLKKLIAL